VALSDAEELRMRQIVAAATAPRCEFNIHRIEASAGHGFYVLEVERSVEAPHAVRVGNALRYPRRDGASTRWLSESEVADAYRNRFRAAAARVAVLDTVESEGLDGLSGIGREPDDVRLIMSVVPDVDGTLQMLHSTPQQLAREVSSTTPAFGRRGSFFEQTAFQGRTGLRRVVLFQGGFDRPADPCYLQLHTSGATFASLEVGQAAWSPRGERIEPVRGAVDDEELVIRVAQLLELAADHALRRCGARGLGLVRFRFEFIDSVLQPQPILLVHSRGDVTSQFHRYEGDTFMDVPAFEHTVDLERIRNSPTELLGATRMAVTDMGQALGRAEYWQISPAAELRMRYFSRERHQRLTAWANEVGVTTTDDVVT
jgi:hypothetical protein